MQIVLETEAPYIDLKWIKSDPFCQDWLDTLRPTNNQYPTGLLHFCRHYMMTPEQFAKLPIEELKERIRHHVKHMKKIARKTGGKNHRNGERISVNSVRSYAAGIQSFTTFLELPVSDEAWKNIKKLLPDEVPSNFRAYRQSEVGEILVIANEREKVIVLTMVSSGIRVGAFPELTFKNILRFPELGDIAFLVVYGKSAKKYQYASLLSPEALQAIDEYKALRIKHGEKITEDSPLIIEDLWYRTKGQRKAIKSASIGEVVKKLLEKAKIDYDDLQPDHSCRKLFNTSCVVAHIDHRYKETMMGHSLDLDDAYLDVDDPKFRAEIVEEYRKVLPLITITDAAKAKLEQAKTKVELEEVKKNSAPREVIELMRLQIERLERQNEKVVQDAVETIQYAVEQKMLRSMGEKISPNLSPEEVHQKLDQALAALWKKHEQT